MIMKLVRDCCVYIGPLCSFLNKAQGQVEVSFLSLLTRTLTERTRTTVLSVVFNDRDVSESKKLLNHIFL